MQSDFVICLAIANEATENLMNAAAFARMKPSAYFINLSRGNLVDEAALAEALDAQTHRRAPRSTSAARRTRCPRRRWPGVADVIATPHTAGLTPDAAEHQAFDTVNQVKELLAAGRMPPGAANPQAAHRLSRLKRA